MATQTLETPEGFPGVEDVEKGDKKKFLVEVKCTDKEDDGMEWEVISIDGVKLPEDPDQSDEDSEDDGIDSGYDDSQDEGGSEDNAPDGTAKTSKGIGVMILQGKK